MKVIDILRNGKKNISIETEPPALGESISSLYRALDPLVDMGIKYINITNHAKQLVGYENDFPIYQKKKPGTYGVASSILKRYAPKVEVVPHVICTGLTKHDIEESLMENAHMGIENLMALRGDGIGTEEKQPFRRTPGGHSRACDLIEQISNLKKGVYVGIDGGEKVDFCIGAACYPEGHPESPCRENDFKCMQDKRKAGTDYFVTQMFFDNDVYKKMVEEMREVPIVPGVKPITTYNHVNVLPSIFNCSIPKELKEELKKHKEDKMKIKEIGIDFCVSQCQDLFDYGVPSIHFFMTKTTPIREIIEKVSSG